MYWIAAIAVLLLIIVIGLYFWKDPNPLKHIKINNTQPPNSIIMCGQAEDIARLATLIKKELRFGTGEILSSQEIPNPFKGEEKWWELHLKILAQEDYPHIHMWVWNARSFWWSQYGIRIYFVETYVPDNTFRVVPPTRISGKKK